MNDIHIHIMPMAGQLDKPDVFIEKTKLAGVTGGTLFSLPPASFRPDSERSQAWRFRLEHILEYTNKTRDFYPFFWIDPTESDAEEQIKTAAESGARGFKIICNHYLPESQIKKFQQIADIGLPIQFHSGILFDHYNSSAFNRPTAFECLIHVKNLKFSLAHMAWPWCDEYIALYGKIRAAQDNVLHHHNIRMYIDITPGTPIIYRREALRKLYLTGYNLGQRVLWGSDNRANDYNYEKVIRWLKLDREIMEEIKAEWKENLVFECMSSQHTLNDIFTQATEKNHNDFYGC